MLVELAAANAAFAVIKEAVQNSGDLMNAGQAIFQYFDSKSAIQKKYEKKAKDAGKTDIEEFFALEQLKKHEVQLREMMIYQGRAGMWNDWLQFQKEAKHKRIAEERAELRKAAARKARMWAVIGWSAVAVLYTFLMAVGIWVVDQIKNNK
jgi:hypothetical protein